MLQYSEALRNLQPALEIDFYKSFWKKGTQDVTSTKGCVLDTTVSNKAVELSSSV